MSSVFAVIDADAASLPAEATSPAPGAWSDWVGMVASIGCAIHCAAMPFVIAYLPALGLSFLADEAFHKWMAVGCFGIALVAFLPGLRDHGNWKPVSIASVGLAMISVAAFGFAGECCPSCEAIGATTTTNVVSGCTEAGCTLCPSDAPASLATGADGSSAGHAASPTDAAWLSSVVPWLTPVGGLVLVSAHLLNRRYGCLCGCCGSDSSEGPAE